MTIAACASAPGKAILFGEHAVVYGEPAVAASLSDLRIYCRCRITHPISNVTAPDTTHNIYHTNSNTTSHDIFNDNNGENYTFPTMQGKPRIQIIMKDLAIDVSFPVETFLSVELPEPPTSSTGDILTPVVLAHLTDSAPTEITIATIIPVIYLLRRIIDTDIIRQGVHMEVRSQRLPVGAGLGSSAAFSVALAACLVQVQNQASRSDIVPHTLHRDEMLRKVDKYAFFAETIIHGTPSGIDNAVSLHGGAIQFVKESNPQGNKSSSGSTTQFTHIANMPKLSLLLVNTHVPRSTKQLVAKVRDMRQKYPTVVQPLLQAMGAIAQHFVQEHRNMDLPSVLTLIRTNQCLLKAVGVSHPSLDAIVRVVEEACPVSHAAVKLTGAGGGGCAIIVYDGRGDTKAIIRNALQETGEWNVDVFASELGGDGVRWEDWNNFPDGE